MAKETLSSKELNRRAEELAKKIRIQKRASAAASRGNSKVDTKRAKVLLGKDTHRKNRKHKSR